MEPKETTDCFLAQYDEVIKGIAKENDVDMGVAAAMFKYNCDSEVVYQGAPDGFDYGAVTPFEMHEIVAYSKWRNKR